MGIGWRPSSGLFRNWMRTAFGWLQLMRWPIRREAGRGRKLAPFADPQGFGLR